MRADVTAKTITSDAINSLFILSPFCSVLPEKQLRAGNHLQGNSLFAGHCNENVWRLAFEAESYGVGSNGFELDDSWDGFPDHRRDEFFDEY